MPFTPFHLGAGIAFKAIGKERFSFMVFGGSQVLIDIEPGVRMILGTSLLHGPTHTLLGALLIGIIASVIGKPISLFVLSILHIPHQGMTWKAAAYGAFGGTLSHLVLDGMMHADMLPWFPL